MQFEKINKELKILFIIMAVFIWLGLLIHSAFLYVPAIALSFAAIAGVCPGITFIKKYITKSN